MNKILAFSLAVALTAGSVAAAYVYSTPNWIPFGGNGFALPDNETYVWDSSAFPIEHATAEFSLYIDEAAWGAAPAYQIGDKGIFKMLWNGSALHIRVKTNSVSGNPENFAALTAGTSYPADQDFIDVGFDVFGDHFNFETDTSGWFRIYAGNSEITTFSNGLIPSLSSPFNPNSPEYSDRITVAPATSNKTVYEFTLQLEATGREHPDNDDKIGLEIAIHDGTDDTWSFWSHKDNALYATPDHERARGIDWGEVSLGGKSGDIFVYSDWRAREAIRWFDSKSNPGSSVWRSDTLEEFNSARREFEELTEPNQAVVDRLWDAFVGLRWADTKYPDPVDLPSSATLPNPYQFFNSERTVETTSDWQERRAEILDLAQFYEYGYMPQEGSVSVTDIVADPKGGYTVSYTVDANGNSVATSFNIKLPESLQNESGAAIIIGDQSLTSYEIAGVTFPAEWTTDDRSDAVAWGNRNAMGFDFNTFSMREMGLFYKLFPYSRSSTDEVSAEMAFAYGASRVIDVLELIADDPRLPIKLDTGKIAIKGFSIYGKYAFVAAVFDERIGVCIPGASGASGLSPWRYVYIGHEYDWTDTPFYNTEASANATASGTEFMGNSIRHNRVRETELFRRFLNFGHMYEQEPNAYGYGTRLPYDQNDLLATLAPRAVILENTVNDYNDGSESDALSMEIAKSVYDALGYDGDELLRFNYGKYASSGDPHGQVGPGAVTAELLQHFFYGTDAPETINPFTLPVSHGKSPFDYYYGGFNAITGGTEGNQDGWYYHAPLTVTAAITEEASSPEPEETPIVVTPRPQGTNESEAAQNTQEQTEAKSVRDIKLPEVIAIIGGIAALAAAGWFIFKKIRKPKS